VLFAATAPTVVSVIVFLSSGQKSWLATVHLNAINQLPSRRDWRNN
jgi:fructose-bisphosphate aldolase class 1